jgi:hypothetical protein
MIRAASFDHPIRERKQLAGTSRPIAFAARFGKE